MFRVVIAFMLIGFVYFSHCKIKIKTTKFEVKKHLDLADINVTYFDAPDFSYTALSFSVDVIKEFKELMIQLSVMVPRNDPNSVNFDSQFFSTRFNFCTFSENKITSIIAKTYLQDVKRKSNFKWECPVKKGHYEVNNFTIEVPQISFVPTTNGQVLTVFSAKIGKSNKFQVVATTVGEGRIWS